MFNMVAIKDLQKFYVESLARNMRRQLPAPSWDEAEPLMKAAWDRSGLCDGVAWDEVAGIARRVWDRGEAYHEG